MGNIVDRNTHRAMMLEILLKDKELFKEIASDLLKEDPMLLNELINDSTKDISGNVNENQTEDISDEEFDYWVEKHFKQFDTVFKALA